MLPPADGGDDVDDKAALLILYLRIQKDQLPVAVGLALKDVLPKQGVAPIPAEASSWIRGRAHRRGGQET